MAGNDPLKRANKAKKDEFYTRLTDIEKEMRHYRKHFAGKTIFCNCDDPFESNFFKYFVLNFNRLGLKKLIATCYTGSPIANKQLSIFDILGTSEETEDKPYKAIVTKVYDATGDGSVDMLDVAELFKLGENELTELKGDGDFRSEECLTLLDEADIVVTNPPFSLFREYISVLMERKKQFIVVGNKNAVTYKEFFPLLMQNKIWVGARSMNQDFWLFVPNGEPYEKLDEEGRHIKHIMACWYTNLDIKKRHEELILVKHYSEDLYPTYDNYPAINVDNIQDIPCDYADIMGVPVTFMDKYNPDQFEILGLVNGKDYLAGLKTTKDYREYAETKQDGKRTGSGGGKINGNPVLKGKPDKGNYFVLGDDVVYSKYARIFIRNKHPEAPKEG